MLSASFPIAPSDYLSVLKEVIFPAGTTQKNVAISIMEDSVLEALESFSVRMTVPPDHAEVVLLGMDVATINIIDDDSRWPQGSAIFSSK